MEWGTLQDVEGIRSCMRLQIQRLEDLGTE